MVNFTRNKHIRILAALTILAAIDQASKTFLITYLKTQTGYAIGLLPFLDIVYAWNYGISFGIFREYYQYSNYAFMVINSIIIIYFYYLLYNTYRVAEIISLILIIGGAIGNLADRIARGAVFDFIYFYYGDFSFPAFNLADSFITIGAIVYLYCCLKSSK